MTAIEYHEACSIPENSLRTKLEGDDEVREEEFKARVSWEMCPGALENNFQPKSLESLGRKLCAYDEMKIALE